MRKSTSDKRILAIGVRMLTPDIDTGSLRMYHLLMILRELSYHVTFMASFPLSWPPHTSRLQEDTDRLRESGIEVFSPPAIDSVEDHLRQNGELYDVVILSQEYAATKHLASVRKYAPQATILYDTLDLHYLRHYREAKVTGNARVLRRALRAKRRELLAAKRADYTLVVSPVEKAILEKECPGMRVHVISSIHELYGSAISFSERKDIVFIGSFQHSANLDAVNYFTDEIYPRVRREITGVKFYIIGGDPPDSITCLSCSDVIVTGYVPDLASYFNGCRLSVAPLRFGAGVKGKVLTSMSYGVPVAASSIAIEGMHLTDGKDVLVADNPDDFCEAVLTLHQNETLWNRLSENGLDIVAQHFSPVAVRAELLKLLTSIEGDE
jgi:glycosyltransferase involved in cell wall biosynthesis